MDSRPDSLQPLPPAGRQMRLVSRDLLRHSLEQAVEETLLEFSGLAPAARLTLRRQILRRFESAALDRARRVRGLTRAEALREFERAYGALGQERAEARQGLEELEASLQATRASGRATEAPEPAALAQALHSDLEELLRAADPPAALARVHERVSRRLTLAIEQALSHERDKADVLERRLTKMRAELANLEHSLAELERRAAKDEGIASIYRTVQGLTTAESEIEVKRALMRQIFEANVALQCGPGARA